MKYLKTGLKKYVAIEDNEDAVNLTPTEFAEYCESWSVTSLKNAMELFDKNFDVAVKAGKVSAATKGNYRSALGRFMDWLKCQTWWQEIFLEESAPNRAPKFPRTGKSRDKKDKSRKIREEVEYGLRAEQFSEVLKKQLEEFKEFRLQGNRKILETPEQRKLARIQKKLERSSSNTADSKIRRRPKITTIAESTFERDSKHISCFFGWCHNEEQIPLNELSLETMADLELIEDYNNWSILVRGNCHATSEKIVEIAIAITKWLNQYESRRRDFSDIPLIRDLRDLRSYYKEEYKKEKPKNQAKKWKTKQVTHEQARVIVAELWQYCAFCKNDGSKRCLALVLAAWQIYIVVKFLVYCPVRQQEIRELVLNKTIFRKIDKEGLPYYEALVKGKDFNRIGELRHYRLPSILTKDLDNWVNIWRPKIEEAAITPESWAEFWGFTLKRLESSKLRLEAALKGEDIPETHKSKHRGEDYIKNLQQIVDVWEGRLSFRVTILENLKEYNSLFFRSTHVPAALIGTPLTSHSLRNLVLVATARATRGRPDIFEEEKAINPHAFRHIAEKQIRAKRPGDKAAFGKLIGHSERMGDEYAEQITPEYEVTKIIVDDWWEEKI